MNSECIHSRCGPAPVPILMIGPSAHLFIQGKMLEGGILGSSITVVFHVQIFGKGLVDEEICVSMLMEFLSAGFILRNTEPGYAKMVQVVLGEFASLPTLWMNSVHYMYQLVLLFPLLAQALQVLLQWILVQP